MILFGTGHRPEDAGMSFEEMYRLCRNAINPYRSEHMFITGMAAGFDLAFGAAAYETRHPIWVVRPWAGHEPRKADRELYQHLREVAEIETVVVDQLTYPGPWVYQRRNEFMIDNADEGIALWNGKQSGGTFNCIQAAKMRGKKVTNLLGVPV